jgi:hypothetical protein
MALVHATCVVIDGAGVLLRGPSGAGKSDLALRLIDQGAMLAADDYCELSVERGILMARAPATIAGKMEVRGQGIVALPWTASAAVRLVADLMPMGDIPRLPETTTCAIDGVTLAWVCIDPSTPSAAARIRLAVKVSGRTS